MADDLASFLWAIGQQESGGNYQANNGIAVGKYQVEKSNVPQWTADVLGSAMTWQQFLADPAAQDKVATAKLGAYFTEYGADGAAAAWYSGDAALKNSTAPQPGGPPIKTYVDDVLKLMGQAPGGGGSGSSGSSASGAGYFDVPGVGVMPDGLLSIPSDITSFFGQATDDLTASVAWVKAFFEPSTYVRIGSGIGGTVFLITGLVLLARAAKGS